MLGDDIHDPAAGSSAKQTCTHNACMCVCKYVHMRPGNQSWYTSTCTYTGKYMSLDSSSVNTSNHTHTHIPIHCLYLCILLSCHVHISMRALCANTFKCAFTLYACQKNRCTMRACVQTRQRFQNTHSNTSTLGSCTQLCKSN